MMVRVCDCVPVPHDLLHALHGEYADTLQCTGHLPFVQNCTWLRAPHGTPPALAACKTERERD